MASIIICYCLHLPKMIERDMMRRKNKITHIPINMHTLNDKQITFKCMTVTWMRVYLRWIITIAQNSENYEIDLKLSVIKSSCKESEGERETDTFSKYQLKNGSGKIRFKHVVIYRIDCKNDFIYTIFTEKNDLILN